MRVIKIIFIAIVITIFSLIFVDNYAYANRTQLRKAFLPNYDTNSITVVDLVNRQVIDKLSLGNRSFEVASRDKSGEIWVTNKDNKSIIKINAYTHEQEEEFYLGIEAVGLATDPSRNRLYVTFNRIDGKSLAVYDSRKGILIGMADVGQTPFGVTVNPRKNHIYVINRYEDSSFSFGTLQVVNGGNLNVIKVIPIGFDPLGVAVHPSGDYVYAVGDGRTVYVIETKDYSLTASIVVLYQPWGIAVNNSGDRLYVVNRRENLTTTTTGSLSVIDLNTYQIIKSVGLGEHPVGISVASDDSEIYITNATDNENGLYIIDTENYFVSDILDIGRGHFAVGDFLFEGYIK